MTQLSGAAHGEDAHVVVVGQWREGQGSRVPLPYVEAIQAAGGAARVYSTFEPGPSHATPNGVNAVMGVDPDDPSPLEGAAALLLPGGGDIDPAWYGQDRHPMTHNLNTRRDRFELTMLEAALQRDMPVLAICHGMQLLNVHLGGTLCQHLADDPVRDEHDCGWPRPEPVHGLRVKERSGLAQYMGSARVEVNSHHHQGIDTLASGLEEIAWAPDGVLEGLSSRMHSWVIGVQWHPEVMAATDGPQRLLFEAFVEAAASFAAGRKASA